MWFREQGHVFDWGTLKWCQAYTSPPNGCYDAENVALDEFGHVEGLGHHDNFDNDSDYLDAVVQTYSRTKPSAGYNRHVFGRCDVARLQIMYDTLTTASKFSTCLDMSTVLTITASPTQIVVGSATTLVATLKVVDADSYGRLGGNLVSGRVVTLQRRAPARRRGSPSGRCRPARPPARMCLPSVPAAATEYRAVFATPSGEGINGDSSPAVRVNVIGCAAVAGPECGDPGPMRLIRKGVAAMSRWSIRRSVLAILPAALLASACATAGPSGSVAPSQSARRIARRLPSPARRIPAGRLTGDRDRATGRGARGRGRRPGHRPAGYVHLGRWRLGQPVAAGLADRRRDRRAADRHDR